jgi:hypothetical protein
MSAQKILKQTQTNVGASLLANAVCQLTHAFLAHRIREQARSHIELNGNRPNGV